MGKYTEAQLREFDVDPRIESLIQRGTTWTVGDRVEIVNDDTHNEYFEGDVGNLIGFFVSDPGMLVEFEGLISPVEVRFEDAEKI